MTRSSTFESTDIEAVRQFWNSRPCNVRHSQLPVGTKEYFDQVEARKYMVEPHIPGFAQFDRWRDKRVLEVGCGLGTDTMNFARAGAHVTAIDLSAESLRLARTRAEVFDLADRIRFIEANAEELASTIDERNFDLIYSFGVLHHTPHPNLAFAQLRQLIAPTGELRMMVYHRWSWKSFELVLRSGKGRFWKFDEIVANESEAQFGCPVTYTYSPQAITNDLATADFAVSEVWKDHIFPYRISEYVRYEYRRRRVFELMPASVFRGLERRMGWHLMVVATPGITT